MENNEVMKILNQNEMKKVSGGSLTFDNGEVYIVPQDNIPLIAYHIIDSNLQRVITGNCSVDQFFLIMNENACTMYLETYFDNLDYEYF
ncbi:hypothetical protein [Candidatus Berkiella aquae]|uniref:Uncharacterized protein n=1 Tax=Candidatus Berkiella aquae TaxID=295108 RepID=A0A0Q9YW36_9GAMM|nr:hypothetical protein [Candidatus Berkiella aquae]MCS5711310.1 hypothetical protein [Candidatus Berkiella aquae]